jgi:hypothetical protein
LCPPSGWTTPTKSLGEGRKVAGLMPAMNTTITMLCRVAL